MNSKNITSDVPALIIGGGPVGLAAAAHFAIRGMPFLVIEKGLEVAASLSEWRHVQLFSPWKYNVDSTAAELLGETGWVRPADDVHPTAADMISEYLDPLAEVLASKGRILLGHEVLAVARAGVDKIKAGRNDAQFAARIKSPSGYIKELKASVVIDASGTWGQPNPLGANGLPAINEVELNNYLFYGIPDIHGKDRERFKGKRVAVVGSGHSAANALLALVKLAEDDKATDVSWVLRGRNMERVFGGGAKDALPARGQLGSDVKALVEQKRLKLYTDFRIQALHKTTDGVLVVGHDTNGDLEKISVDRVVVATGQRPDFNIIRELQVDLDPALESVRALAPMIDPNIHSCGSVPPHGVRELMQPEPDFFVVGSKSYGRAPSFLLATGYEQVRSVVAYLDGDTKAAYDVRLELPETGVCSTDSDQDDTARCCA